MKVLLSLALASLLLLASSQLWAQTIFRCKADDGRYVFQQQPCSDEQVGNDTSAQRAWRKMRLLSAEGITILKTLGADVDSIKICQKRMRQYNADIDALKPKLNRIPPGHNDLFKAYGYIKDCAVCRTSAISACQTANQFLDKAMAKLVEY